MDITITNPLLKASGRCFPRHGVPSAVIALQSRSQGPCLSSRYLSREIEGAARSCTHLGLPMIHDAWLAGPSITL